jgi:hypothetical protein
MKYTYCFSVWPSETWGFKKPLYQVFRLLGGRVEMPFTEVEFERFRSELNHDGFTVRAITRWPHHEEETVL